MNTLDFLRMNTLDFLQINTLDTVQMDTLDTIQIDTLDFLQMDTLDTLQMDTLDIIQMDTLDFLQMNTLDTLQMDTLDNVQIQTVVLVQIHRVHRSRTQVLTAAAHVRVDSHVFRLRRARFASRLQTRLTACGVRRTSAFPSVMPRAVHSSTGDGKTRVESISGKPHGLWKHISLILNRGTSMRLLYRSRKYQSKTWKRTLVPSVGPAPHRGAECRPPVAKSTSTPTRHRHIRSSRSEQPPHTEKSGPEDRPVAGEDEAADSPVRWEM